MLQTLIAWLNGTREYYTGVAIYNIVGTNETLKALFARGYSLYNNFRLQEELKTICAAEKMKLKEKLPEFEKVSSPKKIRNATQAAQNTDSGKGQSSSQNKKAQGNENNSGGGSTADTAAADDKKAEIVNLPLYDACRSEALKVYKETMNKRALLFSMVPENKFEDANRPDLVASREKLALEVLQGSIEYSKLFDRADYVKQHGKLPDGPENNNEDINNLADHEVKQALDNARKAYNKLKGREQTAERVALMQKHQDKIKILEERWHYLKQAK